MPTPNLDRIRAIESDRDQHIRNTLQIIADFPITEQKNQDAHNMAFIARQCLRATENDLQTETK